MALSDDPHAWLMPYYRNLRKRPAFAQLAPSHQFEQLVEHVAASYPSKASELWRLTRGDRQLICVAKYLPYPQGVDPRLLEADGSFRRTQLCKDGQAADELAAGWRLALVRTGWSES